MTVSYLQIDGIYCKKDQGWSPFTSVCNLHFFCIHWCVSPSPCLSVPLFVNMYSYVNIYIYTYIHTYIYYFYISAPMWNISDYSMIIVHTDIDFCRRPDGSLCNVVGHLCARGMGSNTPAARDLNPPKTKQISRRFDVCPVASARCKYDAYVRSNHMSI